MNSYDETEAAIHRRKPTTAEQVEGLGLFDGAKRDEAHARVAGATHRDVPAAIAERDAVLELAKHTQAEWVERARKAMVHLYRERAKGQPSYVTGDDLAYWCFHIGFDGDKRTLAPVFTSPRGLWRCVGRTPSARRHATLIPQWELVEDVASEHGL